MAKITVVGMLNGQKREIEVRSVGKRWQLDNPMVQLRFDELMDEERPVGGTHYPPKNSLLAAYNIMAEHFFDELISISCDEPIEPMPHEYGVIY